ncbi:putative membrane protein [Dyadobacter jejuensis]|uniref:Putative membrane protein n=1 Tax=Dyadobacter jejuensis TaxID=1082580 RepID=A0A316ANB3_9BACT|nr:DUF1549 domain-containing protein [Dyadobacter jejuensis]PWJ58948.1 putative membrane protein [Dyadobacter jejuensis]
MSVEISESFWLWKFLGHLHPLVVHFPVSLLCVALFLEFVDYTRKSKIYARAILMLLWLGTLGAFFSVAFGLVLANTEEYGGDDLPIHQWLGIATLILASATIYLSHNRHLRTYRLLLIATVLGVSLAGHYGAMLTHGSDYLSGTLPATHQDPAPSPSQFALTSTTEELDPNQLQELNIEVRTILAHNCYSCHGEVKQKGDLRLDSKDALMAGGENGPILQPGNSGKSEIIRRISLPANHKEAMPTKGKRLTSSEIEILRYWIDRGAPWPEGEERSIFRMAEMAPRLPQVPQGVYKNPIDRFVNSYFQKLGLKWTAPVDDRTYARRVYLDLIGLLPEPKELEDFLTDNAPNKREKLAQQLLNRNDDYAQHWLTFWNDALRNDYTGTGYITQGRSGITPWLYSALAQNKPYNEFVHQLISPNEASQGFIKGIKWRGTINASQRTEMQAAQNVAQVFLGLNLKCASCHDSFVSDWKLEQAYGFANIFADTLLEINRCDKPIGKMASTQMLFPELGEIAIDASTEQRLRQLADNLIKPADGRLYRTLVNRIWAQLMGRGLIEPVDVMDNLPWSQDLLDWMAYDFTENGFDIKRLMLQIVTSEAYQLPGTSVKEPEILMNQDYQFTGMVRKRLTAEQFADAISRTFVPMYADSSLSDKLPEEIKGKIPFVRASLVKNDAFLTALGRPNRETVMTTRNTQANLLQALELTNGQQLDRTLKEGAKQWKQHYPQPDLLITEMYRRALGRTPNQKESETARRIVGNQPNENNIADLMWAMAMLPEFQLIY